MTKRSRLLAFVLITGLVVTLAAATFPSSDKSAKDPAVAVTGGSVRGRRLSSGGAVFKGVPFARPPEGERRWREPLPPAPWAGVRDAGESGPPCAQPDLGWNAAFTAAGREDCLYLDIWTPEWPPRSAKAVMVWIHGGANAGGAGGADPLYDGEALVGDDVVLVLLQYRLGIFGFFAHPELTRESTHASSGNYGILDQIAALRWVRDNIAAFGGDRDRVTLFGQSAGSMNALSLMTSPLAKGLFHRVIAQSGPTGLFPLPTLAQLEEAGLRAADGLEAPSPGALRRLRALSPARLLERGAWSASVAIDGWVFPKAPADVFASGHQLPLPLIIGSNAVEFPAEGSREELRARIESEFGPRAPRAYALYGLSARAGGDAVDPVYGDLADQVGTDPLRCRCVTQGVWHSRAGQPTWEYEFDRAIPPRPRTTHSGELPYVFGNLYSNGSQAGDFQETDRRLSAALRRYWTQFARTGDPNGAGRPTWPRFEPESLQFLRLTTDGAVCVGKDQRGPFCELLRQGWSEATPR